MISLKKAVLLLIAVFILGCVQQKDFSYGLKQINSLNSKYNTTMETYPKSINKISLMIDEYNSLRNLQLESGQEPFAYIVDYRILNLEAEKSYIEGQKYGNTGTTKYGFGCKPRPLIIESVALRNASAQKGFKAVGLLKEFVGKYPQEAGKAGLGQKSALFLNATFYEIGRNARIDSNTINRFCPENVTLDLYREEFLKRTNLSEDFINSLSYEKAVPIWKKVREIG